MEVDGAALRAIRRVDVPLPPGIPLPVSPEGHGISFFVYLFFLSLMTYIRYADCCCMRVSHTSRTGTHGTHVLANVVISRVQIYPIRSLIKYVAVPLVISRVQIYPIRMSPF